MKYEITNEQREVINELCWMVHDSCKAAGWYTNISTGEPLHRNIPEMLALIHSEVSEMLEGYRKDKKDDHLPHRSNFSVEAADVVIRLFDLCGYMNVELGTVTQEKFAYNQVRKDHKIENRQKPGGKKI